MSLLDRLAGRRGSGVNAGLAVVLAATLAVEVHAIALRHGNWPADGAVGLVLCAAALLRERSRVRAAVAGLAVAAAAELAAVLWSLPGQPGPAGALALLVLIGSAVRVLPPGTAAAIAAGGAALAAVVMAGHRDLGLLPGQGWAVAVAAGLWLRFLDVRRQATIEAVRRDERLELARELHDAAAHDITGVVLQAQAARLVGRRHPETLDATLAGIESAGTDALAAMRRVIGLLRGDSDAGGLTPEPEQLAGLVDRFARRGPAVALRLPDGPADPGWPPEVTATIYRVAQEALTNIARHAPGAREVTVTLAHGGPAITVEVTDDAPPAGIPRLPPAGGYGLVGMRERVEALGGTLSAGPGPGPGWSVLATLPAPGRRP